MKAIKMLSLAALTALMAMAFVGATSAMAAESTSLCKVDEETCKPKEGEQEGNQVPSVHENSVGKAVLKTTVLTVECNVLFSGTIATTLAKEGPLSISGNFKYTECNSNCVVTEENPPVTIKVQKEGHETAAVTGEGLVHVNCTGFINCSYNGVGLKGIGKGPLLAAKNEKGETINPNGEVSLKEQKTEKETGTLCPREAKLTITTTPLTPTYISS